MNWLDLHREIGRRLEAVRASGVGDSAVADAVLALEGANALPPELEAHAPALRQLAWYVLAYVPELVPAAAAPVREALARAAAGEAALDPALGTVRDRLEAAWAEWRSAPGAAYFFLDRGSRFVRRNADLEALVDLSAALEADPEMEAAWLNRGVAWFKLGETQRALGDWSTGLERDPGNLEMRFRRGVLLAEGGLDAMARADLERVRAEAPAGSPLGRAAADTLTRLDRPPGSPRR
jgi:tetratricopeptide (TPR) repeat protein